LPALFSAPAQPPVGTPVAGSSLGSPSASTAIVDSSLLALLPATVAGFDVKEFPEGEQQAVDDPNLGRNVARFATAFVVNAEGTNWAYSAVVALRPGAGTDTFFTAWQNSFDAGACSQAGGISGHVVVSIGGRSVNETTCLNSVRIYHVRLDQQGLLISISSLGDERYGEQVIEGLRP
jgi:hypothetical protein